MGRGVPEGVQLGLVVGAGSADIGGKEGEKTEEVYLAARGAILIKAWAYWIV